MGNEVTLPQAIFYGTFLAVLAAATYTDIRSRIIPNRLILFGLAAGIPLVVWSQGVPWASALKGFALTGGIMLLVAIAGRGAMGAGDVKLGALIGFYLGPALGSLALLLGFIAGAAAGGALLLLRLKGRRDYIPFGPWLALGAAVALFWGRVILAWYL